MRGVCRVCGVRGDGGVSRVRTEGQRRGVDVVIVHHWAGQHQLEQTRGKNTGRTRTRGRKEKEKNI